MSMIMPLGNVAISVHAQILPAPPSPPSAPAKTPVAAKPAVTPAKVSKNPFKVDVILFGVDNHTGNVVTFISVKNQTAAAAVNATDANIKHENSTGVAEVFLTVPNLKLKVGDKYQACIVITKELHLVCATGFKSPLNKTESINLLVSGPSPSSTSK